MAGGGRNSFKTVTFVAVVTCGVMNVWLRGPFFGLLPFLIFTVPPALLLAWIMMRIGVPHRITVAATALAAAGASYALCAPPTTTRLFRDYLDCESPLAIRELKRWNDNWARDPAFHLRFYSDSESVQRIVETTLIKEDEYFARMRADPTFMPAYTPARRSFLPVPEWWQPETIDEPRVWRGVHGCGLELWYDEASGLVYLSVMAL